MEEQTQSLRAGAPEHEKADADPEKTLAAPRFDAREALTAQPVVPLSDARPARRESRQGALPLVLILVSALVGGLVSVFAYRLYQQRAQQPSARAEELPSVSAPPVSPILAPSPEIAAAETRPAPEVIEETRPAPGEEVAEVREAGGREDAPAREEAGEDGAGRGAEAARESAADEQRPAARNAARPVARRVEEITTPTEDLRGRRERNGGWDASDYEAPRRQRAERRAARRAERRAARREGERNIDRVRAIFEGPPPGR